MQIESLTFDLHDFRFLLSLRDMCEDLILDIHTHGPAPKPAGIIAAAPEEIEADYDLYPSQLWSAGYHPWDIGGTGLTDAQTDALSRVAELPEVVAIGETGIDKTRIGEVPLFAQINAFNSHIEIAKRVGKPLIIHAVKAQDIIIPLIRDLTIPVIIHGFRQKPNIARMYLSAGCYLSFGERFNAESLQLTPLDHILAETDCSSENIGKIISSLGASGPDVTPTLIASTISKLLKLSELPQ